MTARADSPPPLVRQATGEDRAVAYAFIQLLNEVECNDTDREAAVKALTTIFGIERSNPNATYSKGVEIVAAYSEAVSKKCSDPMKDEKFISFVELLKKKGYFANCEDGSEEYANRLRKAFDKFQARNNLSADQLKQKGNELMSECKFQEAVQAYTKAIEIDGANHVYYANRAAAQTYLKDYRAAIIDCERAIAIDPTYIKAYSRLGNALFHEQQYERAVEVYTKAVELDPTNASYKTDLKLAEEQWEESKKRRAPTIGANNPFGLPGMDMERVNSMMQNPEMMKMAMQMAQNPQFNKMMMDSMQNMRGSTPEEQMSSMLDYMRTPDENGNMRTPMGTFNAEKLRKLQEEAALTSPKMRAIMEECRVNGPDAFYKYMGDPEVMALMTKMMSEIAPEGQ